WSVSGDLSRPSPAFSEKHAHETQPSQQQTRRFGHLRKLHIAEIAGATVNRRKGLCRKSTRRTEVTAGCRQWRVRKATAAEKAASAIAVSGIGPQSCRPSVG